MKLARLFRDSGLFSEREISVLESSPLFARQKEITRVSADSRKVEADSIFVALKGGSLDGHDYIDDAIRRGCRLIICEGKGGNASPDCRLLGVETKDQSLLIRLKGSREVYAVLCAALYSFPANQMKLVAVTGTNGKTTCCYLLESLLQSLGHSVGVIGTVNYRYPGVELPAKHTTPDPEQLQPLLARMLAAGVSHVLMEVSSHAIEQQRVAGVFFDIALFTNLSHDHLDYHGDMECYYASKKKLFTRHLKSLAPAVICANDHWNTRLLSELEAEGVYPLLRCGFAEGDGDISPLNSRESLAGIEALLGGSAGEWRLESALIGSYNLSNLMGVAGLALGLGVSLEQIASGLAAAPPPPGRMERVGPAEDGRVFLVDYAHSPDALRNVLAAVRPHARRLVLVFGCGGDRDQEKRPEMGRIAGSMADIVLLTSDNPRNEEPLSIMRAIEPGLVAQGIEALPLDALFSLAGDSRGYVMIESRRQAIASAVGLAGSGDVVLVCGKGHENEQVRAGRRERFDDREEIRKCLAGLSMQAA